MPLQDQDHLHRLIRSMTGAEKRYFKLYTSRHVVAGHSNHQALFDAVDAMPAYDLQALRAQFAGQPFMRRFPIAKRRLYEAVLDSLDAFHANSSVDDQVRRMLHHVEVLHHKALYEDAERVLRAATALARAHDRQALLLQAAEWERRFAERANYTGTTPAELDARARRTDALLVEWGEVDRLWQAKTEAFMLLYRSGQAPDLRAMEALQEVEARPLLADRVHLHSARARFLHHHVRSALAYARNNMHAAERELVACAHLLRAGKKVFAGETGLVLGVMGNLAMVRMRLGKHQEALDGFREFRKVPLLMAQAPGPDLGMKLFVMGSSLHLAVLCAQGEFAKAAGLLHGVEEGLARYGARISTIRRAELSLQAAYAAFGAGQHDRALRWCNGLLGEKHIEEHTELHALARILLLACLLELGKHDLLPYMVRNGRRAARRKDPVFRLEKILLDHAQAFAKPMETAARYVQWARLAADIGACTADPREAAVLEQMDLAAWARAKADDLQFADLVKARWRAKAAAEKAPRPKRAA